MWVRAWGWKYVNYDIHKNDVEKLQSKAVFVRSMLKSYLQRWFSKNQIGDFLLICKNATAFTSTMVFYELMLLHCHKKSIF